MAVNWKISFQKINITQKALLQNNKDFKIDWNE